MKVKVTRCLSMCIAFVMMCLTMMQGVIPVYAATPSIYYKSHCQNIGWAAYAYNGAVSGSIGQSLRMEAIEIRISGISGSVQYRTHVQNIGWQSWKSNGAIAGTTGQSLRIEAIEIKLSGEIAKHYDVVYRTHVQNIGWQNWKKNGETAGTTGQSLRVEAIEIKLVAKSGSQNTSTTADLAQPMRLSGAKWSTSKDKDGYQHDVQASNIMNQPVYAIMDGTITCRQIVSDSDNGKLVSYGNVIYFTSTDGKVKATYGHLNRFAKCNAQVSSDHTTKKSQSECTVRRIDLGTYTVKKGEVIGYVGTTGNSSGPHLHFELYINGVRKNPPNYVGIN